jgi:hypothetical protein
MKSLEENPSQLNTLATVLRRRPCFFCNSVAVGVGSSGRGAERADGSRLGKSLAHGVKLGA